MVWSPAANCGFSVFLFSPFSALSGTECCDGPDWNLGSTEVNILRKKFTHFGCHLENSRWAGQGGAVLQLASANGWNPEKVARAGLFQNIAPPPPVQPRPPSATKCCFFGLGSEVPSWLGAARINRDVFSRSWSALYVLVNLWRELRKWMAQCNDTKNDEGQIWVIWLEIIEGRGGRKPISCCLIACKKNRGFTQKTQSKKIGQMPVFLKGTRESWKPGKRYTGRYVEEWSDLIAWVKSLTRNFHLTLVRKDSKFAEIEKGEWES